MAALAFVSEVRDIQCRFYLLDLTSGFLEDLHPPVLNCTWTQGTREIHMARAYHTPPPLEGLSPLAGIDDLGRDNPPHLDFLGG